MRGTRNQVLPWRRGTRNTVARWRKWRTAASLNRGISNTRRRNVLTCSAWSPRSTAARK
ncbi:TPA_asm: UL15.4 sORF 2 [Human alphaherpesvirus 1]|uniref:Uncharacterized protein n=1 Tax=Human herpesvirus 1 TaxID=10298 RepID=A0A2Z4H8D9_HHV1|nr:hypothetical protein [Human alphaherpesvirus 1]DAC85588.1 TPA_asm: UL15.4 sORF 2 [Human alphaherpesvirus 1]